MFHYPNQCLLLHQESMIPNRDILTLRWCLTFGCSKKYYDQEKREKIVYFLRDLGHSILNVAKLWNWFRHSMNAHGIVLITGFLSTLFEVIFLITSRTTHLEGLLPTVRTFTLYLLSTWLTPKTTGKNDGGYSYSSVDIPFLYIQNCVHI